MKYTWKKSRLRIIRTKEVASFVKKNMDRGKIQHRSLEELTTESALSEHFNTRRASHVVVQALKHKMSSKFGSVLDKLSFPVSCFCVCVCDVFNFG